MKKITLLVSLLFSIICTAQVSILEDFNSGLNGWTTTGGGFATADGACEGQSIRDNLWPSSTTGTVTSPNQVGASNGTDLTIEFDYKVVQFGSLTTPTPAGWGSIDVEYSTDDGSNWTSILTIDDNNHVESADCATMMATVSSGDLPMSSDVRLRFLYTYTTGDYFIYVDNFEATQVIANPPNCDSVLTETMDIGITETISWSAATGAPNAYDVTVGTTSGGDDILATTDVGNTTSVDLGQLDFSTTYFVTIVPKNDNGSALGCTEQTFVTKDAPTLPTTDTVFNISCGSSDTYNVAYDVTVQPFVWVQLNLSGGCPSVTVDTEGGDFDTEIGLYDSNGLRLGNNDDGGTGSLSSLNIESLPDGTYYIVAGTFNTIFGVDDFEVSTTNDDRTGTIFVNASAQSNDTLDFFNLQFPATGNITTGDTFPVFAQAFESGLTDVETTVAAGIEAWIGYSTVDSNPNTDADWTWVAASPNTGFDFTQNNDEYTLDLGAELTAEGTYYYASRWQLNGGPFTYGGILPDGSGGGEWGMNGWASGVLTLTDPPPPANDECSSAIALIVDDPAIPGTTISATGGSSTSCNGSIGNDVWYTVVGTGDVLVVSVESTTAGETAQIGIFESADCSGITLGACEFSAGGGTGVNPVTVSFPTVNGTTYYIQTGHWINGDPDFNFEIQVTTAPAPPANDDIATPQVIVIDEGFCDGTNTNATNAFATDSGEGAGDCFLGSDADNDVWFTFTPDPGIVAVNVSTDFTGGTLTDTEMNVYSGTPGNLTSLACSQDEGTTILSNGSSWNSLITDLLVTSGETYYIQIDGYNSQEGTFCLDVSSTCPTDAGTLTADFTPVQLAGADVAISATEDDAPIVPVNYDVVYVLTMGTDLTIMGTNTTPDFTVTAAGDYTIHTLVGELTDSGDPNFLDTSVIDPGVTTGADVLALIDNGGSPLCADLLVMGAEITVEACGADAGTLTADFTPVQLSGADVAISATEGTAPTVPGDYDVLYVLTMGTDLTIMGTNATPDFTVTAAGDYTIHTLVAELDDTGDPNYVDLAGLVTVGTTTGVDVVTAITDNGLCADLLVMGAEITVEACSANAGTLTADLATVQLAGDDVEISATEDTMPTVPTNYDVVYVLTMGTDLTIMDTNATAEFTVDAAGDYTIHTLVAELDDSSDPNFLDVSVIVPGTTTGADVVGIIDDVDNPLCADLLVMGAEVTVETCSADAGTLDPVVSQVSLVNDEATISAIENIAPTIPANYDVVYVLTSGPSLVIEQTNALPEFTVTEIGDYTIHTLVAELDDSSDPNFLDVSVIVPGTTTGGDVVGIIDDIDNPLCADLLVMGAEIEVDDSLSNDAFTKDNFSYYPNPIENELHFRAQSQIDNVTILNMLGQEVMSVSPMALEADLDTSSIAAGTYFARVTIGNASKTIKVIKE